MLVVGGEASGMMAVLDTRLGSMPGTETREPMNVLGLGFSTLKTCKALGRDVHRCCLDALLPRQAQSLLVHASRLLCLPPKVGRYLGTY